METLPYLVFGCSYEAETSETIIREVNERAAQFFGRPATEFSGLPARSVLASAAALQNVDLRREVHARARKAGRVAYPAPLEVQTRDGLAFLRVTIVWPDPEIPWVIIVGQDVTSTDEDQRTEHAGERLSSLIETGAVMAHHLNNSLAAAWFELENLKLQVQSENAGPEAIEASFAQIERSMMQTTGIVRAIAALGGGSVQLGQVTDLALLARTTVQARRADGDRVTQTTLTAQKAEPVWVCGGTAVLQSILDASIALCLSVQTDTAPDLAISVVRALRHDSVTIRFDLREPLPARLRRLLADPATAAVPASEIAVAFYTAHRTLAALGGDIDLVRDGDAEHAFEVRCPCLSNRSAPSVEHRAAPIDASAPRILLVSTDGVLWDTLENAELGCVVEYARTAREALRLAIRGGHDAVIYDGATLKLSSEDFARDVRRTAADAVRRVVFVSRDGEPPAPRGYPVLQLPCGAEEIVRGIASHLASLARPDFGVGGAA